MCLVGNCLAPLQFPGSCAGSVSADEHAPSCVCVASGLLLSFSAGREVRVLVGEPVEVDDLLATAAAGGWGREALQAAIAERVGQALYRLKAELEGLALEAVAPQPAQLRQAYAALLTHDEETLLPLIGERDRDHSAPLSRDTVSFHPVLVYDPP